jgi:hypothetical protein
MKSPDVTGHDPYRTIQQVPALGSIQDLRLIHQARQVTDLFQPVCTHNHGIRPPAFTE